MEITCFNGDIRVIVGPAAIADDFPWCRSGYWRGCASGNRWCHQRRKTWQKAMEDARRLEESLTRWLLDDCSHTRSALCFSWRYALSWRSIRISFTNEWYWFRAVAPEDLQHSPRIWLSGWLAYCVPNPQYFYGYFHRQEWPKVEIVMGDCWCDDRSRDDGAWWRIHTSSSK